VKDINKVVLRGVLIRDAVFSHTPRGRAVATFTIAFDNSTLDCGGSRNNKGFIDVVYFSDTVSSQTQLLKKSINIVVEGRLQQRNWRTSEGIQKRKTEIVAENISVTD
jgi:single stranded DNA-binding protein